jgi:hypothetical protein
LWGIHRCGSRGGHRHDHLPLGAWCLQTMNKGKVIQTGNKSFHSNSD